MVQSFGKTGSQTDGRTAKQSHIAAVPILCRQPRVWWHYYPLGLIKFTTDLLGFAGLSSSTS
ncbi:hypothetical protein GBAR_LOCUS12 [Geodia barretti]|uniref:Uncharacterized protein n=1 Tax=Geodia barretti TaxID=519541 RepID=A0AA35VX20_GEOBA|nr:hypothetical protein GBAR_LOCUS12 [Geodia barretti]